LINCYPPGLEVVGLAVDSDNSISFINECERKSPILQHYTVLEVLASLPLEQDFQGSRMLIKPPQSCHSCILKKKVQCT